VQLHDSDGAPSGGVRSLQVDNHGGARAMVRHLVERGRRRIAFIGGRTPNFDAAERLRGYRDGLAELLPGAEPWILPGDFDVASGHRAGCELLAAPELPDAVFAANDMMALGCLFAFNAASVRVPEDIALAGFDDSPLAQHMHPSLTTLRIDIGGFGEHALRLLLDATADEAIEPHCLQPQLMVRESTA
jgi:LacI family transcriptional regulator